MGLFIQFGSIQKTLFVWWGPKKKTCRWTEPKFSAVYGICNVLKQKRGKFV